MKKNQITGVDFVEIKGYNEEIGLRFADCDFFSESSRPWWEGKIEAYSRSNGKVVELGSAHFSYDSQLDQRLYVRVYNKPKKGHDVGESIGMRSGKIMKWLSSPSKRLAKERGRLTPAQTKSLILEAARAIIVEFNWPDSDERAQRAVEAR